MWLTNLALDDKFVFGHVLCGHNTLQNMEGEQMNKTQNYTIQKILQCRAQVWLYFA